MTGRISGEGGKNQPVHADLQQICWVEFSPTKYGITSEILDSEGKDGEISKTVLPDK